MLTVVFVDLDAARRHPVHPANQYTQKSSTACKPETEVTHITGLDLRPELQEKDRYVCVCVIIPMQAPVRELYPCPSAVTRELELEIAVTQLPNTKQ